MKKVNSRRLNATGLMLFARRVFNVEARGVLYVSGSEARNLYVVEHGLIKALVISSAGEQLISGFYGANGVLGLDGIWDGCFKSNAYAVMPTRLYEVPIAKIMSHEGAGGGFLLADILGCEIERQRKNITRLGGMTAVDRLASFIFDLAGSDGCLALNEPIGVDLKMTREEMAIHLGLKVETVCRALAVLKKQGRIEIRKGRVFLTGC